MIKLEDVCHISSGGTPSRGNLKFYQGNIPWAKISDIENAKDGILNDTEEKITEEGLRSIGNRIFPKGTLLFAMYGSIGKVAITGRDIATNQAILGIRPKNSNEIHLPYLKVWFERNKQNLINQGRGVALQNLSATIIRNLRIPLPSLSDQIHIANILTKAENLISQRKESIRLLDEYLKSTFLEMFGDVRTNSKQFPLVQIGEKLDLITYGLTVRPEYVDEGIPLISAREIRSGKLNYNGAPKISFSDFEKLTEKGKPRKGDILFSKTGSIGHCALIETDQVIAITQNAARLTFKSDINPIFALYYLRDTYIQKLANNTAKGNAVRDLQLGDFKKFKLFLPPISVQTQFAQIVEKTEALKAQYQQSLQELENLYGSLSQRAFKGQLTPKEYKQPDDYAQNSGLGMAAEP